MNGEIGVTSQLDRGSIFWFTATFNQEQAIKRSMKATSNKHSMRHTTDISAQFAHEIRNPLGAAIFSLQYVYERAILSPMSKPYLADALAGAETILSLLNGKLDTEKDKHIKRERTDTKTKSTVSTKIKILVVDDSPLQQKMITQMLKT